MAHFRSLWQKSKNNFVPFLVQMRTRKFAFEVSWPLESWCTLYLFSNTFVFFIGFSKNLPCNLNFLTIFFCTRHCHQILWTGQKFMHSVKLSWLVFTLFRKLFGQRWLNHRKFCLDSYLAPSSKNWINNCLSSIFKPRVKSCW